MAEDQQKDQQDELSPRDQMLELLLEKIEQDPFPSVTQLDLAEQLLTPRTLPVYARVLMDKIRRDPFPSLDLIKRVIALS